MKSKRSWPGAPYRRSLSLPGRCSTPTSIDTVVVALRWRVASVARASVCTTSMSDSVWMAVVLPAPTGPMNNTLHSAMQRSLVRVPHGTPEVIQNHSGRF